MKILRLLALAGLAAMLTGCLLSPGRFSSAMDIRRDGRFTYSYDGQIHLLALTKMSEMGAKVEGEDGFEEQPCFDEESYEDRDCTEEEKAEQKRDWEAGRADREAKAKRDAEMARAMLGGIDPSDPAAAQELVERLRKQAGWEKVEYTGNGLFEVRFRISGRLDHDFLFPTMERFPMSNFFVLASRRAEGTVRVDAPGFAMQTGGSPFLGMMAGMAGAMEAAEAAEGEEGAKDPASPPMPELDGTFTITTDGEILANNTDEGPQVDPAGKRLVWTINKRTTAAPTALVRLGK